MNDPQGLVLFPCTHNAALSQNGGDAAAHFAHGGSKVRGAVLEPSAVHRLTVEVFQERGISVVKQRSKSAGGVAAVLVAISDVLF